MIRDPFNIHRKNVFKNTAFQAAQNIKDAAVQAGTNAIDMSFSIPKQVPNFADPHRHLEDRAWAAVPRRGATAGSIFNGVQERVNGLFDSEGLPMYKDKPYWYAPSSRRSWWRRKRVLGPTALTVVFILYLMGFFSGHSESQRAVSALSWLGVPQEKGKADWDKRRESVVEAFELSWDAYERYAWGELKMQTFRI